MNNGDGGSHSLDTEMISHAWVLGARLNLITRCSDMLCCCPSNVVTRGLSCGHARGWASSGGKEITIRMRYWGDIELPDEDELAETVKSAYIPAADATPQHDADHVEE